MALEADVLFCSEIDFQQWYTFTCRENCKTIVEVDSVQQSENRVEVPNYKLLHRLFAQPAANRCGYEGCKRGQQK